MRPRDRPRRQYSGSGSVGPQSEASRRDIGEKGVRFFAPESAFADAEKYLPQLLVKRGLSSADVSSAMAYFRQFIEPLSVEFYGVFEPQRGTRPNDGYIGLQNHSDKDVVFFKEVAVKMLKK